MWEIWKPTSGSSHPFDRQLSAVEIAQDKVFVTRKMVCTLFGEERSRSKCVRVCVMHTVNIIEDRHNVTYQLKLLFG